MILQYNLIPTITKPTRVTKTTSTLIDNILSNRITANVSSGTIQTDVSDHFPTFLIANELIHKSTSNDRTILKRFINSDSIEKFRNLLTEMNGELIYRTKDVDHAYDLFLKFYSLQYNKAFPEKQLNIKSKNLESPWMTPALLKSSKTKQKLYEKFLKRKTYENEQKYKNYKNRFEKIKKASKSYITPTCYQKIMEMQKKLGV